MARPRLAFAMSPSETRHVFDEALVERLRRSCEIPSIVPIEDFGTAVARAQLADTEILVTGWGCPRVSPDVLAASPRLRLVAHAAGTVRQLLDPAVFAAGIAVTNAVAANAKPVAEYTLAMIILANKRVFEFRDRYRADPTRGTTNALADEPIGNFMRTIGIVGASHIGRRVIDLLQPLDYEVLLYDPYIAAEDPILGPRVTLAELDTLFAESDVVSLHAPSLPSTHGMVGERQLALMRDGATLINTARGALVDEAALIRELESGRISAVVDVTDPEVPPPTSPLFSLPNVFLTPHIAGAIGTERGRLGRLVVEEIERFVTGEPMKYQVDPALLDRQA